MSRRHAVVLSGGGAFAAYEIGVLRALCAGESPSTGGAAVDPAIVTGTSAGSYNGAMLASRWALDPLDALDEMERIWLTRVAGDACSSGVFRWRANPLDWVNVRCFLQSPQRFLWRRVEDLAYFSESLVERAFLLFRSGGGEPVEERLLELLNFSNLISTYPFQDLIRSTVDFRELRRSDIAYQAIATNWNTGEVRVFEKADIDEDRGPLIITASSAIPGIFPVVDIPPHVFVDGGVLMNTPLAPPIRSGATDVHVIYLDPEVSEIPVSKIQTTLSSLQRTLAIGFAGVFDRDIQDVDRVNRAIDLWERGGGRGAGGDTQAVGRITEIYEELSGGRRLRKVEVHRYRPHGLLGGTLGMLNFSADQTRRLIDQGYEDTLHHDCDAAGCVLPEGGPSPAPEM